MNKGRVKKFLDELGVPESVRADIFAETRALARKANLRTSSPMLWSIALSIIILSMTTTFASQLLPGLPRGLNILLGALAVIAFLSVSGRFWALSWWQMHRPFLIQPLHSRGFRYCANCLYNLRGVPLETEYCPECAVYISKRGAPLQTPLGVQIVHPTTIDPSGKLVVNGIDLTPAHQEEILAIMQPARKKLPQWIVNCCWVVGGVLAAALMHFLKQHWPGAHIATIVAVMASVIFVVAFVVLVMAVMVKAKRYPGRFRAATRQIGIEVCMGCGQYLAELDASQTACSQCQSPREPMR
jgi:hypothetical protein